MKYVKSYGQCCAHWFDIFIVFQNIVSMFSIIFDVSSTVYFRFRNYRITHVVFIFDNIVSFSFPMKKCESESGGAFRRSFPTIFIPTDHRTRLSGNTTESYTQMGPLASWGSAMEIKSGGRGRKKKRRRKKRWSLSRSTPHGVTPWRVAPRRTARLVEESRQSMWRDSALPGQLCCQRGRLVAPKLVARLATSRATSFDVTKRVSSWKFKSTQISIKILY